MSQPVSPSASETILRKYATPATLWLSLIIVITGVMMFFHLTPGPTRDIHEWLSLGFALAACAHAWRHRQTVVFWLKQRRTHGLAVLSLLLMAGFALAPHSPSPVAKMLRQMENAPLADLAPVLGTNAEALVQGLRAQGLTVEASHNLGQIAHQAGMPPMHVLELIMTDPTIPSGRGKPAQPGS